MPIDWATGLNAEVETTAEAMACPMPRVKLIEPGTETGELKELYDESRSMWGSVPRYLQMLANAPAAVQGWDLLDRRLRLDHLPEESEYVQLQELIIVKTSIVNRCNYCTGHNVELGLTLGLTKEQMDDVAGDGWKTSPRFSHKQKTVIRWAEAVTRMTAHDDEETFQALRSYFDDRQIVELTMIAAMWNLSNRVAEALHLVVEPPGQRIEFQTV